MFSLSLSLSLSLSHSLTHTHHIPQKKKKNNLTVAVELPSSRLSSHRRHWAPTIADEAPLRANRCRLSSTATLRIPLNRRPLDFPATLHIPLNQQPFAFLRIDDHSTSRRPFAFLWIGDHSTSRQPFTFLWTGDPSPSRRPFAFLQIGDRSLPKAQFPPGDRSPSFPQVLSLSLSLSKFFQFFFVLIFLLINPREIWLMCIFVSTNIHRQRDILLFLLLLLGFLIHLRFWLFLPFFFGFGDFGIYIFAVLLCLVP